MEMNSCWLAFIFVLSHRISIEFTLVCLIGLQRRARLFTHEYYITGNRVGRGGVYWYSRKFYTGRTPPQGPNPHLLHTIFDRKGNPFINLL